MELVRAGKEELDTYVELWFSLAKDMEKYSEFNDLSYDTKEDVDRKGFREHFEDENYSYYLISQDGETIGFTTLKQGEHPSRDYSKYTKIVNLFIKEDYRSQGYGSKVVEEVKQIAGENGSDHLKVSSEWENHGARSFYKENGFDEKQVTMVQELD